MGRQRHRKTVANSLPTGGAAKPNVRAAALRRQNRGAWQFVALVVGVVTIAAGIFVWTGRQSGNAAAGAVRITIDMAGFRPPVVTAKAGEPIKVALVNPDSPYHTDGGGKHNFIIDSLGIKQEVQPKSVGNFTLPALPTGEYAFYCDICCGGKDNPDMWGKLVVA